MLRGGSQLGACPLGAAAWCLSQNFSSCSSDCGDGAGPNPGLISGLGLLPVQLPAPRAPGRDALLGQLGDPGVGWAAFGISGAGAEGSNQRPVSLNHRGGSSRALGYCRELGAGRSARWVRGYLLPPVSPGGV